MTISDYIFTENTMIEFKESLETEKPKSWLKTVSAFANTKGGTILFGIRNHDRALVGLIDPNKTSSKIAEMVNARIQPAPRYELSSIKEDGKEFLELKIGDGPAVPYYYVADGNRIAYIRSGDQSIEAPVHVLNSLILKGQNITYDALPSPYKAEDVSFTLLEATYKNETGESFRRERDLLSFGLVLQDGHITYAGALMCDQGPLRQSRVFCTRWKGTGKGSVDEDALDDKEYQGNLISLLENSEAFVKNNSKNSWSIRGMRREEQSEYPHAAVREALVNALIHRDYQIVGSEIHIDMYDDRMEISSPGGMVDGSRVQDLDIMKIPSMRRNQIVSDLFSRLRFMERRGSGITRIIRSFDDSENKPSFYSEASQFLVTLPNKNIDKIKEEKESIGFNKESIGFEQENIDMLNKTTLSKYEQETEFVFRVIKFDNELREKTQHGIIQLYQKFGYEYPFDRQKVADQFGVGLQRASQIIHWMVDNGVIEKKKNGEYHFKKP